LNPFFWLEKNAVGWREFSTRDYHVIGQFLKKPKIHYFYFLNPINTHFILKNTHVYQKRFQFYKLKKYRKFIIIDPSKSM